MKKKKSRKKSLNKDIKERQSMLLLQKSAINKVLIGLTEEKPQLLINQIENS
jgi:hypothetical protein